MSSTLACWGLIVDAVGKVRVMRRKNEMTNKNKAALGIYPSQTSLEEAVLEGGRVPKHRDFGAHPGKTGHKGLYT